MRFVMCGAGAIGGVLGGQLAKAGFDVIFIDKIAEHVAAINEHGLQLKGVLGNHTLRVSAVMQAGDIDFRPDDAVFLSVKSFHCASACAELRRATSLDLPIFLLSERDRQRAHRGSVLQERQRRHGVDRRQAAEPR